MGAERIQLTLEIDGKGVVTLVSTKKSVDELNISLKKNREESARGRKEDDLHAKSKVKSSQATNQQRDALGKFSRTGKDAERRIVSLAKAQQGLSNAFAAGYIKARVFLGLLNTGFRIGTSLALGPLNLLAGGIKSITKEVVQSTERFDKFRITLEGALKSSTRAREIADFVQAFALKTPVRVSDVQDLTKSIALIPALKPTFFGDFNTVKTDLEDLYQTVIGLSSLNPQQGIPGAVFAIREALTGQFRSLRARFDVMPQIIAGAVGKTVEEIKKSPKLVIAALKEFVNQAVGPETLEKLGALPSVRVGNILEAIQDIAPRQIGTAGFSDFIQQLLAQIDDAFQDFFKAGGEFETKYAQQISDALQGIVIQGIRIVHTLFGGAAAGAEVQPGLAGAAQALINVLETVEASAKSIADSVVANKGNIAEFFKSIVEGLKGVFDSFTKFGEALPKILPVLGNVAQGLFGIVSKITDVFTNLADFLASTAGSPVGKFVFGEELGQKLIAQKEAETFAKNFVVGLFAELDRVGPVVPGAAQDFVDTPKKVAGRFGKVTGVRNAEDIGTEAGLRARETGDLSIDSILSAVKADPLSSEIIKRILTTELAFRNLATATDDLKDVFTETSRSPDLGVTRTETGAGPFNFVKTEVEEFEKTRRGLVEVGNRVAGEFRGTVSSIVTLGTQARTKLAKVLLDPAQKAEAEFLQAEDEFSTSIEKLNTSYTRILKEIDDGVALAISQIKRLDPLGQLKEDAIIDAARKSQATAAKERDRFQVEAGQARSFAELSGLQSTIQTLAKTDSRDLEAFEGQLKSIEERLKTLQPLLTDTATKAFGKLQTSVSNLLKLDVDKEGNLFSRDRNLFFDFADEFEDTIRSLTPAAENFETLLAGIADVTDRGIASKEDIEQFKTLTDQLDRFTVLIGKTGASTLAELIYGNKLTAVRQAQAKRGPLGSEDPVANANQQLSDLKEQLAVVNQRSELEDRIRGLLEASKVPQTEIEEFDKRRLQLQTLQSEQLTGQITLLEKQIERLEEAQSFQAKFDQFFTELGQRAKDSLETSVGDSIFAVFTGDLDSIAAIWDSFLQGLIRSFADFLAQLAIQAAFGDLFKKLLGGIGGGIGGITDVGGGLQGIEGLGGNAVGFIQNATGGIVGPTAGGPILSLVGEGSKNEGIVPLLSDNTIPITVGPSGSLGAMLPGGRSIPVTFMAMGGIVGGSATGSAPPNYGGALSSPSVTVVNVLDPADVVAAGLPANGEVIVNYVAGDVRNRGAVHQSIKRHGR